MILIRHASIRDRDWLLRAYLELLRFLDGQNYLILPTEENAEWMIDQVFIPAIQEGRGVYIGCSEDGKPIAALWWVVDVPMIETRFLSATSYGQWVSEEFRGKGVIPEMARAVSNQLREAGIQQIFDMVHTDDAKESAKDCGFEVLTNVVTLKI